MDTIRDIFGGLLKIIEGIAHLGNDIANLISITVGAIFVLVCIYYAVIYPLLKGNKKEWFGNALFALLLFVGFPMTFIVLNDLYGFPGVLLALGIVSIVLYVVMRIVKRKEKDDHQSM